MIRQKYEITFWISCYFKEILKKRMDLKYYKLKNRVYELVNYSIRMECEQSTIYRSTTNLSGSYSYILLFAYLNWFKHKKKDSGEQHILQKPKFELKCLGYTCQLHSFLQFSKFEADKKLLFKFA